MCRSAHARDCSSGPSLPVIHVGIVGLDISVYVFVYVRMSVCPSVHVCAYIFARVALVRIDSIGI